MNAFKPMTHWPSAAAALLGLDTDNRKLQFGIGVLIGIAIVAGIYLYLHVLAANLASTFKSTETTRQMHLVQFSKANAKATDDYRAASATCAALKSASRGLCNIEAGNVKIRARSAAIVQYRNSDSASAILPVAVLEKSALY